MSDNFRQVMPLEELPANASKAVVIEDRDILFCNAKGEIYAVQNMCTHQRSKLEGGRIRNCKISCPLHGVMFDLKTGEPRGQLTNVPLETFPVRVVDGMIEVAV